VRKKRGDGFYPSVMEEMERKLLRRAREVEGLDEEIALLRMNLALELSQHPKNREFLLKGLTVLIKAMAAKRRRAGDEEDVSNEMLDDLKGLGRTLMK